MLFSIGKWLFLLGVFASLVDGILPRLFAMAFEDGFNIFVGPRYFLMLGFALCIATANLRELLEAIRTSRALIIFAITMLAGSLLINDPIESTMTFYHYFALLAFTPIVIIVSVRQKNISNSILALSAALVPIGLAQGLTDAPLLPTGQVGDKFAVIAFVLFDHIRAFSLFSSSAAFGYFLVLVANICLYKVTSSRSATSILLYGLWLAAILSCIYFTRTRSVYLLVIISLTTTAFMMRNVVKPKRRFVFAQVLGFFLMAFVIGIAILRMDGDEAASTSIERYSNWAKIFSEYSGSPALSQLFGLALRQTDDLVYSESLLIDNSFVSAFAGFGLSGLFFFLLTFHKMGVALYERAERQPNLIPYAATYSTWMAGGVSSNYFVFPILIFFLGLLAYKRPVPLRGSIGSMPSEKPAPIAL